MKRFLTAVASLALLAAPLSVQARPSGGHGGGGGHAGGFHGGGGFRGGGFRGAGYRGGYGGYGYGYGWGLGAAGLGFAAGALLADPWYDGWGAYGDYGEDYPPVAYGAPAYGYAPPPTAVAPMGSACGQWVWDAGRATYGWVPGAC